MGCDLCVYVPDKGDYDCSMAYSSFNRVRVSIMALYLEKMGASVDISDGDAFNLMVNIVSKTLQDDVSKALDDLNTEEADAMKVFWNHSDCDGQYYSEDCLNIASGINKIIDMFAEDDDDKFVAKNLADMFQYAGSKDGIVEVM